MSKNPTANILMNLSEVQLLNMADAAIVAEVVNHYSDLHFMAGDEAVSQKTIAKHQARQAHCGILYAQGKKLERTHPELGRKLILASIFWGENRGMEYLDETARKVIRDNFQELLAQEAKEREKLAKMMRR